MNRQRALIAVLLLVGVALVAVLVVMPRLRRSSVLSGYVEGEALYFAAPVAGTVKAMNVVRGQQVKVGQPLFVVDPAQPRAAAQQAAAEVAAARAQAEDARKGVRPVELAVFDAQVRAAEATARDAAATLWRVSTLAEKGYESRAALDNARAAAQAADANVQAARKQRDAATLGQRQDQQRAAEARVAQAAATYAGAEARLADVAPAAPAAASVEDVFFQQGEWAPANQPILALLPDERIKLKFFVPEKSLNRYRPGQTVRFSCDGCAKGLTARITYISPRPEFTPPVIYSRDTRDRLVFLVEAQPSARLNPGQPVEVEPLG